MKRMPWILVLVLPLFWMTPSRVAAEECSWFSKFIGICDAGKDVKAGIVQGTENIQTTFNPFVQLIYWLHAGTDEQKAQARQILQGAFGMKVNPGEVPTFRATVSFRNLDATTEPIHVALVRTARRLDDAELTQLVAIGEYQDLNFISVVGQSPAIPENFVNYQNDVEEVRKAVQLQLSTLALNRVNFHPVCVRKAVIGSGCAEQSYKHVTDVIANAIVAVVDRRVHIAGSRPSASFPWTGERHLTILIPVVDLARHPKLQVFITLHPADKIDAPLPDFINNEKELVIFPSPVVGSQKLIPKGSYRISRYELKG